MTEADGHVKASFTLDVMFSERFHNFVDLGSIELFPFLLAKSVSLVLISVSYSLNNSQFLVPSQILDKVLCELPAPDLQNGARKELPITPKNSTGRRKGFGDIDTSMLTSLVVENIKIFH